MGFYLLTVLYLAEAITQGLTKMARDESIKTSESHLIFCLCSFSLKGSMLYLAELSQLGYCEDKTGYSAETLSFFKQGWDANINKINTLIGCCIAPYFSKIMNEIKTCFKVETECLLNRILSGLRTSPTSCV